jgi:hypothetical protein
MAKEYIGSKINHIMKDNSSMVAFMEEENWLTHLMKLLSVVNLSKVRQMEDVKYSTVMDAFLKVN